MDPQAIPANPILEPFYEETLSDGDGAGKGIPADDGAVKAPTRRVHCLFLSPYTFSHLPLSSSKGIRR
jgi:hypothetical protein